MSDAQLDDLRARLALKQKELDLLAGIDSIRDGAAGPRPMFAAIAGLLAHQLSAQVCLLYTLDRETGELDLSGLCDGSTWYNNTAQAAFGLAARQALDASSKEIITLLPGSIPGLPLSVNAMLVPIRFGAAEYLGAILLARDGAPFLPQEVQLMAAAESQIDSAVIQGYAAGRLTCYQRELETIFRLDRIRDQNLPLNAMLNAVIAELTRAIESEMGVIMLYDMAGKKLETRASTHAAVTTLPYYDQIHRLAEQAMQAGRLLWQNTPSGDLRSFMCLPLILNEQIIGVIGLANRCDPSGFTGADRRMLQAIGSQIDTAIYERNEIRQLRRVLGRSVDPHVMERLLSNLDTDFLKGELVELTVLYVDIRGSTALAECTPPGTLVEFIRDYLSRMTGIVLHYQGTIDKFIGDEVMALFGAPIPQEDHALRAIRVGLEMQAEYARLQSHWQARGLPPTTIGVGIATGEMIAGEMGSTQRSNYTVIGRAANLGSRICELTAGGSVLVSPRTYELSKGRVEAVPLEGNTFKGVQGEITVYQVLKVR